MYKLPNGLFYHFPYISKRERQEILDYLSQLKPLWEMRFSEHNPPPAGDEQRELLRPVYWLGNWQFACLDYFHPPKGTDFRCVEAEPYPLIIRKIVDRIEAFVRASFPKNDVPKGWKLNTCLINFYGSKKVNGKMMDTARVGEHRDFEPGPVASLSLGDRAFFQFVSGNKQKGQDIFWQGWLEDSSLQIFAGTKWKEKAFHRVQRVENKRKEKFKLQIENFETRRINFTFRYVPDEYIKPYSEFPQHLKEDIYEYMITLSKNSDFYKKELIR